MGVKYLFSNVLGTFVFDEEFNIVDRLESKTTDFLEWSDEEKQLIKKYPKEKRLYLGQKKEKLDGIKISQDPKKLYIILKYFKKHAKDFYKQNLIITKHNVRNSVKNDSLIIQTINNIEDLIKVSNMLSKRLREWYELYNPEFSRSVENHETFVKLILSKTKEQLLKEINISEDETMGADFSEENLKPIRSLATQIEETNKLKQSQEDYLLNIMKQTCPNLTAVAGHLIGAKLIALSGSLRRLALFPASTVQLLGAEKALFRHIRTGARPPKHGVIINHPLVSKANRDDKGRVARILTDKISIAVKVDLFEGEFVGDKLNKEIEKILNR